MSTEKPLQAIANPFSFTQKDVRTAVDADGEAWFCAKDVCDILGLSNSRKAIADLEEDEKGVSISYTLGGHQEMNFISESGLYALIFRSQKPEARKFRRWVTHEVLPQIRKKGFYGRVSTSELIRLRNLKLKLLDRLSTKDAFVHESLLTTLRDVCNQLGEPIPNPALLGQDRNQLSLGV